MPLLYAISVFALFIIMFLVPSFVLISNLHELPAINAPGGFLFEWWSVFWDIFIARTNEKHSEAAASYIEVCSFKLLYQNFPCDT